jgi:predicted RND superfamily exporter protein
MEKNLNPESKFSLSLKEIVGAVIGLSSLFGIYFTLQASVDTNTDDIQTLKNESVNPVEFQYKDELVRSTIQRVEEKTDVLSEDVNEVKEQLSKIDQRLYELSKNR